MSFGRLKSLKERQLEQRKRKARGRRNLSQLAGPQAQGGRKPMQQGYTTTSVKPPPFQQSNVGNDIMQAGLAFKGGKGVHDFATGTEGGYNKAGVLVEGKEPWSLGGKSISDRISQYGTDVSDQFSNAPKDFNNLLNPQPSPADLGYQSVNAPARTLLGPTPPPFKVPGYGGGMIDPGGRQNMLFKTAPMPQSANLMGDAGSAFAGSNALSTQMAPPNLASSFGKALNSVGAGADSLASSNLLSGAGSGSGLQGLGHLGSFSGGEGIQGLGHLSGGSAGGLQGGSAGIGFGGGSTPFGTAGAKGIEAGTSTATSGLQGGGGGTPWMAYANIGKDLIMGGPGSEKITGSTAGDAAIRAAAAYFTFGLSEIPYALF